MCQKHRQVNKGSLNYSQLKFLTLPATPEKLWTRSFISACIGNFLLFFAFYMLVPVFPLLLIEKFDASKSLVGLVLASYTVAALLIRPFAGFVLDMVYRKPVYIAAYLLFVLTFVGYPLVHAVGLFLFFRILHGFTFGFVTTAGNSLVVDILPSARRGEGLGYFGVANNLAMSVGPMSGLMLHESYSFDVIFYTAIGAGLAGFLFATGIKARNMSGQNKQQPVALDRFFLVKGTKAGISLMFMGVPYGMLVTYVAIYGMEIGIKSGAGIFFSLMAVGLIISRLFGGRMVDRGKLVLAIGAGTFICVLAFLLLPVLKFLSSPILIGFIFYLISLIMGLGYGMIFPAYNTLFVNLAPHNRRATASSTYMTSWDIGVGVGLVSGGWIADSAGGLQMAYFTGGIVALMSFFYFIKIAGPHFLKNKLR
ncbi:MAG: MFS transporter [Paludibacter sp.]|nr:MFS transporter [Paludibacter sp.]